MKTAFLTISLLLAAFACAAPAQTFYGTDDVQRFRDGRDRDFRNPGLTPLRNEDFSKFKGLEYFPSDEKFIVKAKFEKTADRQIFTMPTSVGTSRKYVKYGILKFELGGKNHSLTVFQSETAPKKEEYKDLLFVPFRDLTNGTETYGAGRYMDIKAPAGGEMTLNFNLAYNMSCAYGRDDFSCSIPPKENFLQTEIKAGEKIFPSAAGKQ
jgi:uncharacterized protein (DUF1684 family)